MNPVLKTIYDYLDRYVSGQEHLKKKLATVGYLYLQYMHAYNRGQKTNLPYTNLFITGDTGTGKTYSIETLASWLQVPYTRIDCTSISAEGWTGNSISDALYAHSRKITSEKPFGIIVLDEMDKLGTSAISAGGTDHNRLTQTTLLDLLDGKYNHMSPPVPLHVNHSLVICAGAFTDAFKESKKLKTPVGFGTEHYIKEIDNFKDFIVENGIIPELAGRITDVVSTNKLTKPQIRDLITKKQNNILTQYKILVDSVEFDENFIDKVVDHVYDSPYGIREANTLVFNEVERVLTNETESKPETESTIEGDGRPSFNQGAL